LKDKAYLNNNREKEGEEEDKLQIFLIRKAINI